MFELNYSDNFLQYERNIEKKFELNTRVEIS